MSDERDVDDMDLTISISDDSMDEFDDLVRLANEDNLEVDTPEAAQERKEYEETRDKTQFPFFMAHLLRCPDLLDRVGESLAEMEFFASDIQSTYLFSKIHAYHQDYGKVNLDALKSDLAGSIETDGWDIEGHKQIMETLDSYAGVELAEEYAAEAFKSIIRNWRMEKVRDQARQEKEDLPRLRELLEEIDKDLLSKPKRQTIFDDFDAMLEQGERFASGISWFDNLLNGGACGGEIIGVIAPSGGGKSTLAHQFLNEQVNMAEHCVYISAEQKLEGDFTLRQAVLSTKSTRADWDDKKASEVDPKLMARLMKVRPLHEEYFHFFDFVQKDIPSMKALLEPVYDLIAEGKKPKYVLLDWWGPIRDHYISAQGLQVSGDNKRMLQRGLLRQLSALSKELNVAIIVFHQLSGQAASKGAKAYQSSHDAQEDKNFNNYFDFAITLGKKGSDDMVRLMADKARRTANTDMYVKLDGAACRFVNADNPDESAAAYERGGNQMRGSSPHRGTDAANMWSGGTFS